MQPIEIEIPMRTPTLNDWQRMHWSRRRQIGKQIASYLLIALVQCKVPRPDRPIPRCRIFIERESTQSPDPDSLVAGVKPLLDALQPPGRRHPYGLGLILDDSPKHVIGLEVLHVAGKGQRTRIRIEPAA